MRISRKSISKLNRAQGNTENLTYGNDHDKEFTWRSRYIKTSRQINFEHRIRKRRNKRRSK